MTGKRTSSVKTLTGSCSSLEGVGEGEDEGWRVAWANAEVPRTKTRRIISVARGYIKASSPTYRMGNRSFDAEKGHRGVALNPQVEDFRA